MTGPGVHKDDVLALLAAAQTDPHLSARAHAGCTALLDKLRSPVRIGMFGLPGVGKRAFLNALVGDRIAAPDLVLPTFDASYGAVASTQAILADGSAIEAHGVPTADIEDLAPVYLQVRAPAPFLQECSILLIAADPTAADMSAALAWAEARVDVTIWCTRYWSHLEQEVWQDAPDSLRDHAMLVCQDRDAVATAGADGFETVLAADPRSGDVEGVRDALRTLIHNATTEDIHAAQMFLHRHGGPSRAIEVAPPPVKEVGLTSRATTSQASTSRAITSEAITSGAILTEPLTKPAAAVSRALVIDLPGANRSKSRIVPAAPSVTAQEDLARLFHQIRQSADDIRALLPEHSDPPEDAGPLLRHFEEVFEALVHRVETHEALEDTWPELCTTLFDARDLALLLRVEGGAAQLEDAALLLLQVRHSVEQQLAA